MPLIGHHHFWGPGSARHLTPEGCNGKGLVEAMWHHGHGWLWPGPFPSHAPLRSGLLFSLLYQKGDCSSESLSQSPELGSHGSGVSAPGQVRLQTWHPTSLLGNRPGAWHPQASQNGGKHLRVVIRHCNDQMREILPVKKVYIQKAASRGEDHGCTSVNRAWCAPHALGPNSPGIRNTGQDGSLRPYQRKMGTGRF